MSRYRVRRLGKYWWILGDDDFGPYGPYFAKREAEEDKRGLKRSLRYSKKRGFVTSKRRSL